LTLGDFEVFPDYNCVVFNIALWSTVLKTLPKLWSPAENVEEVKGFRVQNGDLEFNLFPGRINSTLARSPVSSSTQNES